MLLLPLHPRLPVRSPARPLLLATATMHSPSPSPSPSLTQQLPQNPPKEQQTAIDYHNRTKHSLTSGYARGPRGLDWAHQPNPFLRFPDPSASASPQTLPLIPPRPTTLPTTRSSSPPSLPSPPPPLSLLSLSRLLFDSLSLSAWKTTASPHGPSA
ncbi:hypothetical protein ACMD2_09313 [Ananas comosus]|uniref:Uncharacterized protein n=1 Tax=Ananas comosus TaxID=4615 RepID=A0A199VC73_ANACO|nr:hypothetical protein ACMD2_09313 [Ananas comosus]